MKTIKKLYDLFFEIVKYVCVAIMVAMVCIVAYCVFMRYVMNSTPRWGDEMAIFCMIWFCLLSASWAFKENRHIRIGFWETILSHKAYVVLEIIVHVLAVIIFAVLLHYAMQMITLVGKTKLSGSGLPIKYLYLSEPVAAFCMLVAGIGRVVEIIGRK